jgi:hypothetical protein
MVTAEDAPVAGALIGVNGVMGDDLICTAKRILEGEWKDSAGERADCWLIPALLGVCCWLPGSESILFLVLGCCVCKTSDTIIGIASSSSSSASLMTWSTLLVDIVLLRMLALAPDHPTQLLPIIGNTLLQYLVWEKLRELKRNDIILINTGHNGTQVITEVCLGN